MCNQGACIAACNQMKRIRRDLSTTVTTVVTIRHHRRHRHRHPLEVVEVVDEDEDEGAYSSCYQHRHKKSSSCSGNPSSCRSICSDLHCHSTWGDTQQWVACMVYGRFGRTSACRDSSTSR